MINFIKNTQLPFCGRINKCNSDSTIKVEPLRQDVFVKNSMIDEANKKMTQNLELTSSIQKALKSNSKESVFKYLEEFSEMTTLILRSYPKDDVIAAVQTFIDVAAKEEDEKMLKKYINIIHSSICPNTGVGKYVNVDETLDNCKQMF